MSRRGRVRNALKLAAAIGAWVVVAAACTGDGNGDDGATDPPVGPTSTSPSPTTAPSPAPSPYGRTTEPTETPPADTGPITISFAGDIHFEGVLRSRLDDPGTALAPVSAQLSAADLTVVNLESSIGTSGTPEPKRYTFQAPPTALHALSTAGVDVVTMANNHGVDFGPDGLADTLSATAQASNAAPPLQVVGIGANADEAFAPAIVDVRGTSVAVFGASVPDDPTADPTAQWAATDTAGGIAVALDPRPLLRAVAAAEAETDVVVVYLHWGVQGESCPSPSQRELAGALAEAGADVVTGSHTHRLQGAGRLGDTFVAYGLGNFAWYTQSSAATSTTGVLTLTVDDGQVTDDSWAPARIGADGLPEFAVGAEATQMADEFAALRECTDLTPPRP